MPANAYDLLSVRVTKTAFVLFDQRQTVVFGKIRVGFVDDQRASQRSGDPRDFCRRNKSAAGAVRIGQEHQANVVVVGAEGCRQLPAILKVNLFPAGALNVGQRAIQDVTRIRQSQLLAFTDEAADQDRQNIVAAVAGQNPFRSRQPKCLGGRAAKRCRQSDRDNDSAAAGSMFDRLDHCRRRRVRVLVGVQLDELARRRLFAGSVRQASARVQGERAVIRHAVV